MKAILIIFLLTFPAGAAYCQSAAGIFQPGEELLYEVSFLGVKLGSIKIETGSKEVIKNHITYKTKAYIDTYKGVPFISFHAIFDSWLDTSGACSYNFRSNWNEGDDAIYDEINFDYENNRINMSRWKNKKPFFNVNVETARRFNEGLSLLFFARRFTGINRSVKVPTIVHKDTVYTKIYFSNKKEKKEIDAVNHPISTVYLNGSANWSGIYGMSGYFEGWFSDDEARIPVKARINVYLGYIDIELVKWKRNGWEPPN